MNFVDWARRVAFPLWLRVGVDWRRGGYHEQLGTDLVATEEPRRARLTARQIYCFLVAYSFGVPRAREAVLHGLDFLQKNLLTPEGAVHSSVDPAEARKPDRRFDPYDYAFVLFALSVGARLLPHDADWQALGLKVLGDLERHRHPHIGFDEPLPLKANPHMHLLEAFLSWEAVDPDMRWRKLSDEMVSLCLTRFTTGTGGAITEYFESDWKPRLSAVVVEPGHQFEWAWLLMRWATSRADRATFAKARDLVFFAERAGVVSRAGISVAVNSLTGDGEVADLSAKLWPQSERIKALNYLGRHPWTNTSDVDFVCPRLEAAKGALARYLDADVEGLWRECLTPNGFNKGLVKASSFYHIVCAIEELETSLL